MLIAFHKPCGFISQFTPDGSGHGTLADFGFPKHVHPIGRLDALSEGLLLLGDEPFLNKKILAPENAHSRTYWAQVEGIPARESLAKIEPGIVIGGRRTLPCRAWLLAPQPLVQPRVPPIRFRKNVADCWVGISLIEGKNHQVRRMTAAIGHPTLRLIRVRIGEFDLAGLAPGQWREMGPGDRARIFAGARAAVPKLAPPARKPAHRGKRHAPSRSK